MQSNRTNIGAVSLPSKENFKTIKIKKCWSYIDTLVSGSPIIQNGKLVGAVTHVLVDDPAKGYGIFAETMLETAMSSSNQ